MFVPGVCFFLQAGFDALYFGRIDYQDAEKRIGEKDMEMLWRSSRSSEEEAQIFTGGCSLLYIAADGLNLFFTHCSSLRTSVDFGGREIRERAIVLLGCTVPT